MRKRLRIGLGIVLLCGLGLGGWHLLRPREPVYAGRTLESWIADGLLGDNRAWTVLVNTRPGDAAFAARMDEEVVRCAIGLLRTRDSLCWKPYSILRTNVPPVLAERMPLWREPRAVRLAAARLFGNVFVPSAQAALPALCEAARNDPDLGVRRAAIRGIGQIGVPWPDAIPIMTRVLEHETDPPTRCEAADWCRRAMPDPEKTIPVLVASLVDPHAGNRCAYALAAYGARARFAVPSLVALAKGQTNDRPVGWRVWRALREIDPEAASQPGIRQDGPL